MPFLSKNELSVVGSIKYISKYNCDIVSISGETVALAVESANHYLYSLKELFGGMGFDIYETLGQRNLSGFVGEIFGRTMVGTVDFLTINPHADGRPDLLDLSFTESHSFFHEKCFDTMPSGERMPLRNNLAPYKFGGLEVKSSIGNPYSNYKKRLMDLYRSTEFKVGMERVDYLDSITYWGHHLSCENLLAIYYDYPNEAGYAPQILAVFHSELSTITDWNKVSVGKIGSKKTSNTSLTLQGRAKVYDGTVVVCNLPRYVKRLNQIGVRVLPK